MNALIAGMPGGGEIWIIAIAAIILFGGAAIIPKVARNIGKAKNEFKKGLKEGKLESEEGKEKEEKEKED